ncbi:MAG TPA: transcription-repair coupling factor [Pirellulales bacterium]|nr:transcription-repair coupling factor [Pirellulales bacterium]
MANAELEVNANDRLQQLVGRLERAEGFAEVVASLRAGHGATLDGVRGSSCALVAAALANHAPGPLVVVLPQPGEIDDFCDDLAVFAEATPERFPAWEASTAERSIDDDVCGDRLRVLKLLQQVKRTGAADNGQPAQSAKRGPRPASSANLQPSSLLLVASIQGLMQPVPSEELLARQTRRLVVGNTVDVEALTRWLVEQGFHNTSAVQLPGEFSSRGGILDLFAPDWFGPVRIELFGDQVESIRRFEVETQRSLGAVDSVELTVLDPRAVEREHLAAYLPPSAWFLLVEPGQIDDEARNYLNRQERSGDVHPPQAVRERIYRFPSVTASGISIGSMETTCRLKIESVERFSGDIAKVRHELDTAGEGQEVFLVSQTDAEAKRLAEIFAESRLAQQGKLHFPLGRLRAGFRLVADRIVLISGNELFHRTDLSRPSRRRLGRVIDSFLELREGDYVVHLTHGIGRYRGMKLLDDRGQTEDHLEIEFHGGAKVYVPASKIELVQKYVGGSKSRPTLARIGGQSWVRQKRAAEEAVVDLASDMLDLQAARAARSGIRFPIDTEWQREFDASFPYMETPDQLTGIAAIKRDMHDPRPMDRLICGDVGYGKTELAMRAAFKAVDAGYQAAILVPTTVLAEQHGRTFRARLAEYPFEIAVLSRFCTPGQQKRIVAGMADGSVDIVIGTHRLAQADVQFHNLGLLIIDEEQRFGVEVKERLKAYRHIIDVLTMTATPIPRTLHMSLLGLRDISNLETPPADRLSIETRVTRFDDELVRHAAVRELNRGGQMFFVHNRVHDIQKVAWRLQQIVPEAKIAVGHGQMPEGQLEQVMLDFVDHKFDLLLATTIIESGLDIPNANTIFIDDADQYGLADLHQLRGRVGRYKHRAYCYLLVDPNKSLTSTAVRRLAAIEEFSDMGAGFAIAMRDLEIRGAGNILGTQQSGHIAAVGYELYCDLLDKAVRKLKQLPPKATIDVNVDLPGEAYLPRRYVPDMRLKIDLYRRLARIASRDELAEFSAELVDRFGPRPELVDRLLERAELAILAAAWGIANIHLEDEFVVFRYANRAQIEKLARTNGGRLRIVDGLSAYLPMAKGVREPDAIQRLIKSLLRPQ